MNKSHVSSSAQLKQDAVWRERFRLGKLLAEEVGLRDHSVLAQLVVEASGVTLEASTVARVLAGTKPARRYADLLRGLATVISEHNPTRSFDDIYKQLFKYPDGNLHGDVDSEQGETGNASATALTAYDTPFVASLIGALLANQLPWGEWSDRRTPVEMRAAERIPFRGFSGPKPNVARTLFAIEALQSSAPTFKRAIEAATYWVLSNVSGGWFREWTTGPAIDSDDLYPAIFRRPDIRHTAQALTIACSATSGRQLIEEMIVNLTTCQRDDGFWGDDPTSSQARLLSTVYAAAALGKLQTPDGRAATQNLIGERLLVKASAAFSKSIAALTFEALKGGGLLGEGFTGRSPYITGLALFRLASLGFNFNRVAELIELLLEGISASRLSAGGWTDSALPPEHQEQTRIRTNLRIAAGVSLCEGEVPIPSGVGDELQTALKEAMAVTDTLDTPDLACLIIACRSKREQYWMRVEEAVDFSSVHDRRTRNAQRWVQEFRIHEESLRQATAAGTIESQEIATEFAGKLKQLERLVAPGRSHALERSLLP